MAVFVDTSAFFALLDADDQNHAPAAALWAEVVETEADLISTNYVLVETFALLQRRLGVAAVQAFAGEVVPVLQIEWVDEPRHRAGVQALLAAARRQLSLVDCVSFRRHAKPRPHGSLRF